MIKKLSPAKVNLHLRVLRKRADGYHDIATLMQRISLYDEMTFHPTGQGITVSCPGSPAPENENNIVFKAVHALLPRSSSSTGMHITINKMIPMAAGLGGGSSNAATAMTTINDLMGLNYTRKELLKIGATIGADVPFFILGKPAWALGIGDRLRAAARVPHLWFVLLNPGFGVSTKTVYERLKLRLTKRAVKYKCPALYTVEDLVKGLHNDLEDVTMAFHPVLQHLKDLLMQNGALGALMSGSGPTIIGVYKGEKEAAEAKAAIENMGRKEWSVLMAHSI